MHKEESKKENLARTQMAYEHLKRKIQICDYMPGQKIYEKQLNEELGYGRTPIREAILALKNEKLLEIYPRSGMRVTPITLEDVNEIYQARKIMEPAIVQEFKSIYSKTALLEFEARFREEAKNNSSDFESDIQFYSLDIEFHMFLVQITNNKILTNIYNKLMEQQYRLAIYGAKIKYTKRSNNFSQHQDIIEAILKEDNEQIRKSLITHINHSLISSLNIIKLIELEND